MIPASQERQDVTCSMMAMIFERYLSACNAQAGRNDLGIEMSGPP